jgi:cell division protein ZapE
MTTVLARYERLVGTGELRPDIDQRRVAERLDLLARQLEEQPTKGSVLWRMLGRRPEPVRGVYLCAGSAETPRPLSRIHAGSA